MRFLILTQYYEPEIGAAQVRLGALAREIKRAGHEVEVVTGMPNHPEGRIHSGYRRRLSCTEFEDGVTIRRVWLFAATGAGVRRLLNYVSFAITSLVGLVRCARPDVIFVESPPPFLMVPAWVMGIIWRRPVVMNVADLWPDSATQLGLLDEEGMVAKGLGWFEHWCYRRASAVCAVTDGVRLVLEQEKSVPAAKVVDLPNGVDTELFRPRLGDPATLEQWGIGDRRVVLYAGTVGYAHAVETAVDAMYSLRDSHPDAHLLVVGGGSEWSPVEAHVAALGAENVTMVGPVPLDAVADLLAVSAIAVSTLRDSPLFEGTRPSKLFPAFASGVPVAYAGHGEGARLVSEHGAGVVCPPEDPAALADAIALLLDDNDKAGELGSSGRELAERRFAWSSIVADWLTQLEALDLAGERSL